MTMSYEKVFRYIDIPQTIVNCIKGTNHYKAFKERYKKCINNDRMWHSLPMATGDCKCLEVRTRSPFTYIWMRELANKELGDQPEFSEGMQKILTDIEIIMERVQYEGTHVKYLDICLF